MIRCKSRKRASKDLDLILPYWKGSFEISALTKSIGHAQLSFIGLYQETQVVYTTAGRRIYLLGLGDPLKDARRVHLACRKMAYDTSDQWGETVQVDVHSLTKEQIGMVVKGFGLASNPMDFY